MNENIRLEDEELLFVGINPVVRIQKLNEMGIFTVKDFINTNVTILLECKYNGPIDNPFVVYQEILKYKYRGQKMTRDVYLDRKYHRAHDRYNDLDILTSESSDSKDRILREGSIYNAISDLGFFKGKTFRKIIDKLDEFEQISMINAIKLIAQIAPKYKKLCDFYLEYYEKEIKKSVELDSNELENLKNQLVELVRQKADLDSEISRLVEQVNILEGGNITNGRK